MHARTRRSHAPKPTPGATCTVSLRGREPYRMRKKSPPRRRRRTRSASTHTFGPSSARSNRRDTAREASCTSTASSASGLPTTRSRPWSVRGLGIEMTIVERRDVLHESHATRSRPAITLGSVPVGDTNSSFVQSQTLERRAFPGVIEHIHFNIRGGSRRAA